MTFLIKLYKVLKAAEVLYVSKDFSSDNENKQWTKFKMICISFAAAVQTLLLWASEKKA